MGGSIKFWAETLFNGSLGALLVGVVLLFFERWLDRRRLGSQEAMATGNEAKLGTRRTVRHAAVVVAFCLIAGGIIGVCVIAARNNWGRITSFAKATTPHVQTVAPAQSAVSATRRKRFTTAERVTQIIASSLMTDVSKVKPEDDLQMDLGADPMAIQAIIDELGMQYRIYIPDRDAAKIKTVGDAIRYIEQRCPNAD